MQNWGRRKTFFYFTSQHTYSVPTAPSKFCWQEFTTVWVSPIRCHRESLQDSATLHFAGSHNGNGIWKTDWAWMLSNRTCFMEHFLATFGHLGRVRFTVQNYCGREKCQAPPWAFGWRAWRKPSANFLVPPKLGYSVRTLRPHTCLILPCVRSGHLHVKRYSRPRSSKELHKREKYQISPTLKNKDLCGQEEWLSSKAGEWA